MCRRAALEIQLLALLVSWGIHGGWEVDHPCKDRLDKRVVQQIHRETDATEEVEDGRCKDLAGSGGEEDSKEHCRCTQMIPVATYVGLVGCDAVHRLLHDVRPVGVLRAVLRVASEKHAEHDHQGWDGRGEDGGRGVLVMVMEFGDEHACDDIETLEGTNCETYVLLAIVFTSGMLEIAAYPRPSARSRRTAQRRPAGALLA